MSVSDQDLRDAFDVDRGETLRTEIVHSFRGRQRWLIVVIWIVAPLIFAFSVWAAVRFFGADETRDQILYATLFLWASVGVGMLKSWYYARLDRNAILRELKRLELQLAPPAADHAGSPQA